MAILKRQKVLLGLLSEAPKVPGRTELMKWAFLLRNETCLADDEWFYDFVPYRFGPFSFTLFRDLDGLRSDGFLVADTCAVRPTIAAEAAEAFQSLPRKLREAVMSVLNSYGRLRKDELVERVYAEYPWFASRSELTTAKQDRPARAEPAAYTAGYERESVDHFLQKLLKARIERILDVRKNPISRKYGFSKGALSRLCGNLEIDYCHIPELGIPSAHRRSLSTPEDYANLMAHYERHILPGVPEAVSEASHLMSERPTVLVCFEADQCMCHRRPLAEAIAARTDLAVVHI